MEIKLTDSINPEMSIEQLAQYKGYIGLLLNTGAKYFMLSRGGHYVFTRICYGATDWRSRTTILGLLKDTKNDGVFHYFETVEEIYKWMSE